MPKICIVPCVKGTGGMASFRLKFEEGLRKRGIAVTNNPDERSDTVLVIAGTRHLLPIWRAKRRGARIVQRLDGINWVQRVRWSGARYTIRAEYGNVLMAFIRNRVADRVIYQSKFIRTWWEDWYGAAPVPGYVILNGVNLKFYSPESNGAIPTQPPHRLVVVEGSLSGGLDTGLKAAVQLTDSLSENYHVELTVAGIVNPGAKDHYGRQSLASLRFLDVIPREQIPALLRSSHVLFSAEINPPCPNSVIEALACGLPVVGFDTGSLHELVQGDAGRLIPYGGDPWKLETPDVKSLAKATEKVLQEQARFRQAARERAEQALGVDKMVDEYLRILLED